MDEAYLLPLPTTTAYDTAHPGRWECEVANRCGGRWRLVDAIAQQLAYPPALVCRA